MASVFNRLLNLLNRLGKSDLMKHPASNTSRLFCRKNGYRKRDAKNDKAQHEKTDKEITAEPNSQKLEPREQVKNESRTREENSAICKSFQTHKPDQKLNTERELTPNESSSVESTVTRDQTRFAQAKAKTQDSSDLLLDITHLSMDQIKMNLEDLNAEVTVRVELTNQIHIDITTDVQFDKVNIDMKNVEITAQIKVNLKKISEIIDRVLKSIEDNPELLNIPINNENVLAVNLSVNPKRIKETLDNHSEKVIEAESHVKKD